MISKRLLCSAVILLFASFPGAVSGAMSWVSSAQWPFSCGQDDGVMPVPSLLDAWFCRYDVGGAVAACSFG